MKKLVNKLLEGTTYSGKQKPKTKKISASSLDQPIYFLYNRWMFGDQDDNEFDATTIGSIFQLGCDSILKDDDDYEVAVRRKIDLDDDWILSGEVDLIDRPESIIWDFKLLAATGYKKMESSYIINMSVYRVLFPEIKNYKLFGINKGGSKVKNNLYKEVDVTYYLREPEDIVAQANSKIKELMQYVDTDTVPPMDCDIYAFGKDTKGAPNKCKYYCQYSKVCPSFNSGTNNHFAMKALL